MTDKNLPSVEYLRKRLRYEPETGKLFWLDCEDMPQKWRTRYAATEAFTSKDGKGYLQGQISNELFRAHRVAWAIHFGSWPNDQIDHINGTRNDNRIVNLRVVSHKENHKNQSMRKNNTSGATGVILIKSTEKWHASIRVDGRKKHLGSFNTFEAALSARAYAVLKYGYTDRHGT